MAKIHGGKRSNAGRKKITDKTKKISVATYHKECDIELIGGMEAARDVAFAAIERKIKKS